MRYRCLCILQVLRRGAEDFVAKDRESGLTRIKTLMRYWRRLLREDLSWTLQSMVWVLSKYPLRFSRVRLGHPVSDLPVFFINLDRRPDRRAQFEETFGEFQLSKPIRIPGVEHADPMIGCSLAHQKALSEARKLGAEVSIIAEDDVMLRCSPAKLHAVISEFCGNSALDVLCVGNRVKGLLFTISDDLAVSNDIQTASFYVVKKHALGKLIQSMEESAQMLASGLPWKVAAPDTHWKKLQKRGLVFAVPRERCATQRAGYSDIGGKEVDYDV